MLFRSTRWHVVRAGGKEFGERERALERVAESDLMASLCNWITRVVLRRRYAMSQWRAAGGGKLKEVKSRSERRPLPSSLGPSTWPSSSDLRRPNIASDRQRFSPGRWLPALLGCSSVARLALAARLLSAGAGRRLPALVDRRALASLLDRCGDWLRRVVEAANSLSSALFARSRPHLEASE